MVCVLLYVMLAYLVFIGYICTSINTNVIDLGALGQPHGNIGNLEPDTRDHN